MIFAGNMLYAYKIDKPLNLSLILYDTCNICANIWRSSQSMMETFILWVSDTTHGMIIYCTCTRKSKV